MEGFNGLYYFVQGLTMCLSKEFGSLPLIIKMLET